MTYSLISLTDSQSPSRNTFCSSSISCAPVFGEFQLYIEVQLSARREDESQTVLDVLPWDTILFVTNDHSTVNLSLSHLGARYDSVFLIVAWFLLKVITFSRWNNNLVIVVRYTPLSDQHELWNLSVSFICKQWNTKANCAITYGTF